MARRSKRIGFSVILAGLLFLAVLSMVFLALVFRRGDTFHPESKKRYTILFSKRVIAQACSMVFSVWDPYAQTHRYAVTSPEREVAPDPQTPALETLKALQDYFDSSISSGSITARVTVKAFRNGDLPQSCFRFYYQRAGESKLDSLNRLYGLRAVFKADSIVKENDFIQLDHLMRWLHDYLQTGRRMESDIPKVDFNFNALDILYRAGQGERFICSEYSTTLVQCLASIGYTARYVMLNSTRGGHVACEAWSDSYDKWVLLDPYFCRTVTADGIPLSVYQVHRLLAEHGQSERASLWQRGEVLQQGEEREFYLGLFQRFAVRMRNDWFTNRYPHWYPLSNSVMNSVEWQDELTGDNIHYRYETSRLADLYWPLNRTRLSVYPEDERHLEVFLDTFTPNFSHFNLTLNSAVGSEVREVKKNKIKWRLEPGLNILQVAAVNDRAVEGRLARVEILLGPDGGEKGEGGE